MRLKMKFSLINSEKKMTNGAIRELNTRPLEPKTRIIPLNQSPLTVGI